MSVEQSRLSQFSCSLGVHAFPGLMRTCRPFLLDLLMKGSVYFANSDEVVLQSDSPGGADLQIFLNQLGILLIHLQIFLNDLGIFENGPI